jgi:4-amino-4-deoxy-L-arabinose transferase-like glycosyltransferase
MRVDERGRVAPEAEGLAPVIILAGLTLLAFGLRFYRLGNWGMESDEVFMLRDSLRLSLGNPRPLMYFLNHYVVYPFLPLDEFGIRLLPAISGVLTIPVFYAMTRRLVGTRAALIGAFFIATSGLFITYSQFGRYWTLVFLLSCVFPYALYLGIRDGNGRMLALGSVTAVLAALAHPVSILLLGGLGAWIIVTYAKRDRLAELWGRKGVRWTVVVAVILTLIIAMRFVPMLQSWIRAHDRVPVSERGGEFLLHTPGGQGIRQLALLLVYVQNLTPPLILAGLLGIFMLWRQERSRSMALLMACLLVFPAAFILLVQIRTAVSIFYLIPTMPALFIGTGIFLDRLIGVETGLRPRWLLSAAVGFMIFADGAPTLISQYRDGKRYDFRGAARWLDERMAPGDVLFSDQPQVVAHYLPEKQVRRLVADPVRLARAADTLQQSGGKGLLWIVTPAPSHAFRTNPKLGSMNDWIYTTCQLRSTIGVGRLDFRQNYLQIYRCPPAASAPGPA